jgi:hypothetical protein
MLLHIADKLTDAALYGMTHFSYHRIHAKGIKASR